MSAKYYTKAYYPINFPEDKVMCKNCPELTKDRADRMLCRATGCLIFYPNEILDYCPLVFKEELKDE